MHWERDFGTVSCDSLGSPDSEGEEVVGRQARVRIRRRSHRGQQGHEVRARRQGCQPRRDGQHGPARSAGLHDHLPGVHGVLQLHAARLPGGPCRGDRRPTSPSSRPRWARSSATRRPAARLGALRLAVLDAGHDGHVLNLGLNDVSVQGLIAQTGNERFAWDSYRRFIQMFSKVVLDVEGDLFENAITDDEAGARREERHRPVRRGHAGARRAFKEIVREHVDRRGVPRARRCRRQVVFPQDVTQQLHLVDRGRLQDLEQPPRHRLPPMEKIPDDLGTAVNVQSMVFGNKGETSATGVALHAQPGRRHQRVLRRLPHQRPGRRRRRGHPRTPSRSRTCKKVPAWRRRGAELDGVFETLENAYRDMCDIEFTIEQGKLWMLQTRVGKRTARAALKIAVDMVDEGMITREEAVLRIDPTQLDQLLHPQFDATADLRRGRQGPERLSGRGGRRGRLLGRRGRGGRRRGTQGHPRALGDHARRPARHDRRAGHPHVARRQDEPRGRRRPRHGQAVRVRRREAQDRRREASRRTSTGPTSCSARATSSRSTAPPASSSSAPSSSCSPRSPATSTPSWRGPTSSARWACAPTPTRPTTRLSAASSAPRASACAAPSTCSSASARTSSSASSCNEDGEIRAAALAELLEAQIGDYLGIFEAMDGLPVTVRLLDPPLHEFLDSPRELEVEIVKAECAGADPA